MLKDLVINSLTCSWLDLQRPCSELRALTPSSDPYSVPPAELRSAGHGCGITSERSHPGRFSSLTPAEAAGTARSAEAVTAIPPRIWDEGAGSEPERIPVPGDGADNGRGAEAAGQAASRAGRHCRDAHPPGYTLPAQRRAVTHSIRSSWAGGRSEVRNTAGASATGTAAQAERSQLSSRSQIFPPKNQADMRNPSPGCY